MNTEARSDGGPGNDPQPARHNQVGWLLLKAQAAQAALDDVDPDASVLLVTLEHLEQARRVGGGDLEAVLARMLLSPAEARTAPQVLHGPNNLELRPSARLAFCNERELQLTSTEFALLQELLTRDGAVVSVDGLSHAIWGHETLGAPNYVEAHISRLRRKLRDAGAGQVIETVRGAGYRVRQPVALQRPNRPSGLEAFYAMGGQGRTAA